jgi:putative Mg2+ transporter-C (MgtC) family protein
MLINTLFPESITDNYIIRLLMASVLGALIGLERDIHGRAAGLRTNLLVSLGSALFMIISETIAVLHAETGGDSILRADPGRIAANIITGIGFLGAGAIIKYGFSIRGLTTAACLWVTAGIGMSSGAGYYELSIITTAVALFSLVVLNRFERLYAKDSYRTLEITTSNDIDLSRLINVVKRKNINIVYLDKERDYEKQRMLVKFTIRLNQKGVTDKLSHIIVQDLENSGIPIFVIRWWHQ